MKNILKKGISFFLVCIMVVGMSSAAFAESNADSKLNEAEISAAISKTADYLAGTVTNPVISSIGGEWAVLGLARSEADVPQSYYDKYYNNVVSELKSKEGNLSDVKYTEYSRLILALTAIGRDVTDAAGYNLLEKLADYNRVVKQGINGPIFALIALDSNDYAIPQISGVTVQTTRQMLIDYILSKEITDANGVLGGFSFSDYAPDTDLTGMALQALAKYKDQSEVKAAIDRALLVLDNLQLENAGFESHGTENLESLAQVIVAKSALDIDAQSNVGELMEYYLDDGSMRHTLSGGTNQMATEQGFYALVSYARYLKGQNSLYHMTDTNRTAGGNNAVDSANSKGLADGKKSAESGSSTNIIQVSLNGKHLDFVQAPVNVDGRVLVPMRGIFEAMGAEILWDDTQKKVTGILGDKTVELIIGGKTATINGEKENLDVPGCIINNYTMVPVRFISEGLDARVEWQKETNTVVIVH